MVGEVGFLFCKSVSVYNARSTQLCGISMSLKNIMGFTNLADTHFYWYTVRELNPALQSL